MGSNALFECPRAPAAPPKDDYVLPSVSAAESECANSFGAASDLLSEIRIRVAETRRCHSEAADAAGAAEGGGGED